jgi:hypothetical protein
LAVLSPKEYKMSEDGEQTPRVDYNGRLETLLGGLGEQSHCLSLLHKRSEAMYDTRRTYIELPVIIGSGLIGLLSSASGTLFHDQSNVPIALGVASFLIGTMQTVNTYFGWSKRAESHRIASVQYARIYITCHIELSLPRHQRHSAQDLLKQVKTQFERLQEVSPLIPKNIIKGFKADFEKPEYKNISKPPETNGLEQIIVFGSEEDHIGTPSRFHNNPLAVSTPQNTLPH